jgi:hypothetical protein
MVLLRFLSPFFSRSGFLHFLREGEVGTEANEIVGA